MLAETFSNTFPFFVVPLSDIFLAPGVNFKDATTGRLSVGVALLVRKEFGRFVDRIHTEYNTENNYNTVIILYFLNSFWEPRVRWCY